MSTTPDAHVHPGWSDSPAARVPTSARPTGFGDTLQSALTNADRSQAWLCRQIACDHGYINRIIRGRQPITLGLLARIVRVFPADRRGPHPLTSRSTTTR